MASIFDMEKLVEKLAEKKLKIRKLKVDDVKVKLNGGSLEADLLGKALNIEAKYAHTDGVEHKVQAVHAWGSDNDSLTIDDKPRKTGLDIEVRHEPVVTLGSVDLKITIDWTEGSNKRKIEIYVQLAKTLKILRTAGIIIGV